MLLQVKWTSGRSEGELGKSSFWKYLFPSSDRLDQKFVLQLSGKLEIHQNSFERINICSPFFAAKTEI